MDRKAHDIIYLLIGSNNDTEFLCLHLVGHKEKVSHQGLKFAGNVILKLPIQLE